MLKGNKHYTADIENLENYLALYLCIKGIKDKDNDDCYNRKYLTSSEALKLMGLDVKECQKVNICK